MFVFRIDIRSIWKSLFFWGLVDFIFLCFGFIIFKKGLEIVRNFVIFFCRLNRFNIYKAFRILFGIK